MRRTTKSSTFFQVPTVTSRQFASKRFLTEDLSTSFPGDIEFAVNKVNAQEGEFAGVFVSKQPGMLIIFSHPFNAIKMHKFSDVLPLPSSSR